MGGWVAQWFSGWLSHCARPVRNRIRYHLDTPLPYLEPLSGYNEDVAAGGNSGDLQAWQLWRSVEIYLQIGLQEKREILARLPA